jgi:hypothetical protein
VRGLVNKANTSRQPWIRQVGMLMRTEDESAATQAEMIGRDQAKEFRAIRAELDALELPAVCDSCHLSVTSWLDKHIAACDLMVEVGQTGELSRLRATQGLLAEARVDLQRFNSDCDALVVTLRRRAESAKVRRASKRTVRWPFAQPKAPAEAT